MLQKITPEQETVFWRQIAAHIEENTDFGNPSNWNTANAENFQQEMDKILYPLCKKDKAIEMLCVLINDKKKSVLESTPMTSSILDIFSFQNEFRKRHSKVKNRFTYFLFGISFDEYIESGKVIDTAIELPIREMEGYLELFKDRAETVRKEAQKYYNHVEVTEFMEEFEVLHQRQITHLQNSRLVLAHLILDKIHTLSRSIQIREDKEDSAHSFFSNLKFGGMYSKNKYAGAMINIYLSGAEKQSDYFLNFFEDKPKTEMTCRTFYQELLKQ